MLSTTELDRQLFGESGLRLVEPVCLSQCPNVFGSNLCASSASCAMFLLFVGCGVFWPQRSCAQAPLSLAQQWHNQDLQHQSNDLFYREGFVYVSGGTRGRIAKINIQTGNVAWAYETHDTYQPSYPVSNGHVVIFGMFYSEGFHETPIIGVDDRTGKFLWKVNAEQANLSSARFAGDLAFIGSYDHYLYAIDWRQGAVRWKTELGDRINSTPCIYRNLVVIGCSDGNLYCLDRKTGNIEAKLDCGGRLDSNPVVANDLLFVLADSQRAPESYDYSKVHKTMLVVDMRRRRIFQQFSSMGNFAQKIIVVGKDVYFFGRHVLYAYDSRRVKLLWTAQTPQGVAAYPIVLPSKILLAMNYVEYHVRPTAKTILLDRATGQVQEATESGDVGILQSSYVQSGDRVVTGGLNIASYKVESTRKAGRNPQLHPLAPSPRDTP